MSMPPIPDQCYDCRHFNAECTSGPTPRQGEPSDMDEFICAAFPGGIPQEVQDGTISHTKPYPGDHGIMYEKDLT